LPRAPDERVGKAHELFKSGLKLIEIASQLDLPEGTVRSWKNRYKWNATLQSDKRNVAKRNKGGQPGNKNAINNDGGAPVKNDNAVKHGLFEKYLPQETLDIVNNMSLNPLDILWDQIQIAYAAIVRAQKLSYVRDQEDNTIIRSGYKDGKIIGEDFLVQTAIDKHSKFMQAQARAQGELRSMIKQYDEMLHNNWELATEEQKARIAVLKDKVNSEKDIPIQITFTKASDSHGN
jgi:uncharacterized protein YjcR